MQPCISLNFVFSFFFYIYGFECIMFVMTRKQILTKNLIKKERIDEIDLLRGIPIFLVVLYHFCWTFPTILSIFSNSKEMLVLYPNLKDFVHFLNYDILNSNLIHLLLVPVFGGLFIFVCGISSIFTRNNVRRSLLLWSGALLISGCTMAATYIIKEDCYIDWGVLHLMAFSVTVYALLELFFKHVFHKKVPIQFTLSISGIIFLISVCLSSGYDPFTGGTFRPWGEIFLDNSPMPIQRYLNNPADFFLEALGKYGGWTDWWAIFPYTGVFFAGVTLGKFCYEDKKRSLLPWLRKTYVLRPICFCGRHTIWIYILHQPIIIVVLFIVFTCMGFRL